MDQAKLEETLDDLEDGLERERRKRTEEEKTRRKIEADVKLTQVKGKCAVSYIEKMLY